MEFFILCFSQNTLYKLSVLQETHSGENTHNSWKYEWGNDAFWSGINNNSAGIGILINPTVSYTVQNYTELIPGRMQALELIINDKEINLSMYMVQIMTMGIF